jgi:hypothetical protein
MKVIEEFEKEIKKNRKFNKETLRAVVKNETRTTMLIENNYGTI